MTDRNEIECMDCRTVPKLVETPYADTGYIVACDCDTHSIDVTDCVGSNSLMNPMSGKWSNIDHNHEKK